MDTMTQYIQNGGFGASQPMNMGYNPYTMQQPPNNIISFGGYQTPYQQQNNSGYTFQAISQFNQPQQNYYNPYGTSYGNRSGYTNPYGIDYNQNYGYQQPQYGYYGQPQYGYQPYGYNNPYNMQSMAAMMNRQNELIELRKSRQRDIDRYFGRKTDEDWLDRCYNPNNPANRMTDQQVEDYRMFRELTAIAEAQARPVQPYTTEQIVAINCMNAMNQQRQQYDNHSLCQFLEDDLWQFQKQAWIEKNCKPNNGRDMSDTYNSSSYNELLNMHRSSNPYINQLLDNSRYDNNLDDTEIGMQAVIERERRRREILSGKVPDFVSSPEVQQARHEWTQQVLNQIYGKEANKNV